MFVLKKKCLIISLMTLLPGFVAAGPPASKSDPNSSNSAVTAEPGFVSVEVELSIALSQESVGSINVEALEGKTKGGKQFVWKTAQGIVLAGFVELSKAENGTFVAEQVNMELLEQQLLPVI